MERDCKRQELCREYLQLFSQELREGEEQEKAETTSTCKLNYFISRIYSAGSFYLNNKENCEGKKRKRGTLQTREMTHD